MLSFSFHLSRPTTINYSRTPNIATQYCTAILYIKHFPNAAGFFTVSLREFYKSIENVKRVFLRFVFPFFYPFPFRPFCSVPLFLFPILDFLMWTLQFHNSFTKPPCSRWKSLLRHFSVFRLLFTSWRKDLHGVNVGSLFWVCYLIWHVSSYLWA